MSSAISVEDVSKRFRLYQEKPQNLKQRIIHKKRARYEEFWALRDVSLEIEKGTTFGLIGHNGSGKSTLLRIMAGIHRATSGTVHSEGRVAALLELGAGFHPDLTGRENVYLNGSILGLSKKEIARCFDDIVEFSGLASFIDTPVKLYSSGMFLRLGFSVAVHLDPEILLIDEIIAVGDEEFQRRCLDHIHYLRRQGVTIVLVSHSLAGIKDLCARAAWLDHGCLMAAGPAAEVVSQYLASVNRAEQQRLGQEVPDGACHRPERRQVEIDGLEFLDGSGLPVQEVPAGAPVTLRMHFRARATVDRPSFSMSFHHESGVQVAASRTPPLETSLGEGKGYIDYALDRLILAPGSYLVSAAIHGGHGQQPLDEQDRAFVLHIRSTAGSEREGMVELPGHWRGPTSAQRSGLFSRRDATGAGERPPEPWLPPI